MTPNNLRAEMSKFNITLTKLAEVAGLSRQGLYTKIEGKKDWKLTEMVKIYQFINTFENIDFDLLFTDYIERALNA